MFVAVHHWLQNLFAANGHMTLGIHNSGLQTGSTQSVQSETDDGLRNRKHPWLWHLGCQSQG